MYVYICIYIYGKLPNIDFNHVDVSSLSREITMCKNKQNDTDDAFQLLNNSVTTLSTEIFTLVSSLTSGVPKPVNATGNSLLPLLQTSLQRQPPNSCLHISPSPLNAVDHPRAQHLRQSLLYILRRQPRLSRRSLPRRVRPLLHNSLSRPLHNRLHLLRQLVTHLHHCGPTLSPRNHSSQVIRLLHR